MTTSFRGTDLRRRENNPPANRDMHSPPSARGIRMRRWLVGLIVLALVLVAAPAGAAIRSGSTTTNGVTPKEIKLGVTYVDLAAIRSQVNLDIGDFPKMYTAI